MMQWLSLGKTTHCTTEPRQLTSTEIGMGWAEPIDELACLSALALLQSPSLQNNQVAQMWIQGEGSASVMLPNRMEGVSEKACQQRMSGTYHENTVGV